VAPLKRAAFLNPGRDLAAGVDLARRAEGLGYDSAWVTHGSGRDSFLVLAAYGAATTRLGLGNGVVPIYPRHPVAMAQAALTLSEISGGRFRLGIGVSHKVSMETSLGLTLREPLAVTREYVALGGTADFEGRHYKVNWTLAVPERPAAPPIYLAALSKKMLELAGEIADGVVLWLCSPDYVRDVAVPALQRGRARAGKSLAGFEIVAAVPLAIWDDGAAALAAFRGELARYLTLPFYRAMLEASGLGNELAAFDRNGDVAEGLTRAVGGVGKPEAGRAFVRAYRDAGVTLPAIRPITFPEAPWYRRTLEEASTW
jgi:alkanesulfonate monooxygenase SsuD/methylene tetrahydromethanopterin reductase-like flavin-dependent oxidoreductase (luciferase family)